MKTTAPQKVKRFERPVIIRTGGSDRTIADVNAAAEVLLKAFPRETARRRAAMEACLGVIRGVAHPPLARRAFVSAALEVGILAADQVLGSCGRKCSESCSPGASDLR